MDANESLPPKNISSLWFENSPNPPANRKKLLKTPLKHATSKFTTGSKPAEYTIHGSIHGGK